MNGLEQLSFLDEKPPIVAEIQYTKSNTNIIADIHQGSPYTNSILLVQSISLLETITLFTFYGCTYLTFIT